MADDGELFEQLLRRSVDTPAIDDAPAWWAVHLEATRGHGPVATAVLGGFAMDRLGYAFASGYSAALQRLCGDVEPRRRALCATESTGAHPRAIACKLELDGSGGGRLTGDKSFVTLGELAEELLVVARSGEDEHGRPQLRVVQIPATREGVRLEPASPTPFVPEIPHARVSLRNVRVEPDEVLAGDGYLRVLKPFRTIEDIHVFLAMLGWLTKLGRRATWSDAGVEQCLYAIAGLSALAHCEDPLSPALHRALAGALAATEALVAALERSDDWQRLDQDTRTRWARDRALLGVAGKVRARRLEAARRST